MSKRGNKAFQLVLIKPSHYAGDGYVLRWLRTVIPSNSLAALYGLALDCARRRVLGPDTEIVIDSIDETNSRVNVKRIVRSIRRAGGGLVGFVGVQSNQFPRTMDLARQLRAEGIQVCIGGFHVSGCLTMLPGIQPDLQEALDLGMSLFAGEAEGRLDRVLLDARAGNMASIYDHLGDLPSLADAPTPFLPAERLTRTHGSQASFDAGRGCPFQCSFCTIINVQGRVSRRRTPDDVERIIRANLAQDIRRFFITDDNFARNKDWEAIFDRLIELREDEGIKMTFTIQVDTLCHRISGFIEKAARAGVKKVFIGLENINPEALAAASKKQNKITEYRAMMQAWRNVGVITFAGYIIGFPGDTPESIAHDIRVIQRELPVDILEYFMLTPLPGSADHKALFEKGVPMEPDMNKYDLTHITTGHARMSADEWQGAFWSAWTTYYSPEHTETLLRRAVASGISARKMAFMVLWFRGCATIEGVHPLEGGFFRLKFPSDRRPGLPVENPLLFYLKYGGEIVTKHLRYLRLILQYRAMIRGIRRDPDAASYSDLALAPVTDHDAEDLEMLSAAE
ncbi:MAG: B12-binding domain-containing radical SAM protein [Sphingomonadales bacterium]